MHFKNISGKLLGWLFLILLSAGIVNAQWTKRIKLTFDNSPESSGWQYRTKITFLNSQQSENLQNFPVLIKLNSSRIDYSHTSDNGEDIRFYDSDGTSLAYEIEKWDESGDSYVWVRVPQIDGSSNTDYIWMYYGNPAANDAQNPSSVWSNQYEGVWHMGTNLNDQSGNSHNGTAYGANATDGFIAGATEFDDINQHVDVGTFDVTPSGIGNDGLTIETWFKVDNFWNDELRIISKADGHGKNDHYWMLGTVEKGDEIRLRTYIKIGNKTQDIKAESGEINEDNWYYGVVTFDGESVKLYRNAIEVKTKEKSGTLATDDQVSVWIGSNPPDHYRTMDGWIDEVRVSTIARSDDWIRAQYLSMKDDLLNFGNEETIVSSSSEDLVNFPVLVVLNSSRVDYNDILDAGQDIRFTDPDGTVLAHEIENWDENGNSYLWVKVPRIDENSTTDYIYMYYGNQNAIDWQQQDAVWDSNYKAVWHFNNTLDDATSNNNNGSNHGTSDGDGQIGSGRTFDGSTYIEVDHHSSLNLENMTIEAWVKRNGDNTSKGILEKGNNNQYRFKLEGSNQADMFVSGFGDERAPEAVPDNEWTYLVGTYSNSSNGNDQIKIYYNDELVKEGTTGWGTPATTSSNLIIGGFGSLSNYFTGNLDELRLSNTVRSAAWLYAQYQSMTDNFITYNSPEDVEEYGLPGNTGGDKWTVCSTGGDFSTIQAAINDASVSNGDTILICPGTYNENVTVTKSLVIMGEDSSTVIVDAANNNSPVFTIDAVDVTLMKMTIQGTSNREAIRINSDATSASSSAIIRNNFIKECRYGIRSYGDLKGSILIKNNRIEDLSDDAIYLLGETGDAINVTVRDNNIDLGSVLNYTNGIFIRRFVNARIQNNDIDFINSSSYLIYGRDLDSLIVENNNVVNSNTQFRFGIYAKDIVEYIKSFHNTFPDGRYGLYTTNNSGVNPDIDVIDNDFSGSSYSGISLDQGDSIKIISNDCVASSGDYQRNESIRINSFVSAAIVDSNDVGPNNINRPAFRLRNGPSLYVRNNTGHGIAGYGIYSYAITNEIIISENQIDSCRYGFYQAGNVPNVTRVTGNDFSGCYTIGIYIYANNEDSVFIMNNETQAESGNYQTVSSIYVRGPNYGFIQGNTVGTNKNNKDAISLRNFSRLYVTNNTSLYQNEDIIDARNISDYLEVSGNSGSNSNSGIEISTGSPTNTIIKNNLFFNCNAYGIYERYGDTLYVINNTLNNCNKAIYLRNQVAYIRNNILSNNNTGIYRYSGSHPVTIAFNDLYNNSTDYHNVSPDTGNISVDPLFVDETTGDFHLQSQYGSYHDGLWTPDANHSDCIDAGDPNDSYANEPYPNGGRINMGAYGNTSQASLSADINQYTFPGFPRLKYVFMGLPAHPTDGTPPGDPAAIVGDDFGGNPGDYDGWRVSHWNSPRRTYDRYEENDWDPYAGVILPDSSDLEPPDFAPGIGFWVLQNVQDNPTISFNGYEVNPNENFVIPLTPATGDSGPDGFNQLANPLNSQMDWSECLVTDGETTLTIQEAADSGWINQYAYTYNWEDNYYFILDPSLPYDAVDPWDGFWVIQQLQNDTLSLLVPPGASIPKPIPEDKNPEMIFKDKISSAKVPQFSEGWFLQLVAKQVNGNYKDVYSGIGVHENASDQLDQMDAFEQPVPAPEYVEIFFPHHLDNVWGYWEDDPVVLSYDIQSPEITDTKWWLFVVLPYNLSGDFAITWPNIASVPGYIKLALFDAYGNEVVPDMRETSSYTFTSEANAWNYFWVSAKIEEDSDPPEYFVGYLQNPLFTNDLSIYVLPSERMANLNVSVIEPDNTPVYINMSDELNNVYSGKYRLGQSGSFRIRVDGSDIAGNSSSMDFPFTAELTKPNEQITAYSSDGSFGISLPPLSDKKQFYLLIEEKGSDGLAKASQTSNILNTTYSVHPLNRKLDNPATVSFEIDLSNYSDDDLSHFGVILKKEGNPVLLPTKIYRSTNTIKAETFELGDFKLIFDRDIKLSELIPEHFALYQNYPNPFNSRTIIEYEVPRETHVRITIFNIRGQAVRTLVDEPKKAGHYKVNWDGYNNRNKKAASGTYFIRMEAGKFNSVKKLTLVQ